MSLCYIANMNEITFSETTIPAATTPTPRAKYPFQLICVSKCKRFALEVVKSQGGPRASKFTRVSEDFLVACEANLKSFIASRVKTHPSKGKTLT